MNSEQEEYAFMRPIASGTEIARMVNQAHLVTETMGALPELLSTMLWQHVLDIGSGPGTWVLDLALADQQTEVLGIDKNRTMIEYARTCARVQGLDNAQFRQMDALQPLALPDASFDLVHARFLASWLPKAAWPALLGECLRVLRPGGMLCLVEGESALTSSPACERLSLLYLQAIQQAGYSFSPDGRHLGITPLLGHFLRAAGCQSVQQEAFALDFSLDAPAHKRLFENHLALMPLLEPFLLQRKVTTSEDLLQVVQQATIQMLDDEFCGLWWLLRVWGHKP